MDTHSCGKPIALAAWWSAPNARLGRLQRFFGWKHAVHPPGGTGFLVGLNAGDVSLRVVAGAEAADDFERFVELAIFCNDPSDRAHVLS